MYHGKIVVIAEIVQYPDAICDSRVDFSMCIRFAVSSSFEEGQTAETPSFTSFGSYEEGGAQQTSYCYTWFH